MKYFKISIEGNGEIKNAVANGETLEVVEAYCKKSKLENFTIEEINFKEFEKIKKQTPETKEELKKEAKKRHEEASKIDLEKFKGKKLIPFEGCPYKILTGFENATKENILVVANSLNPFGFKKSKEAAKYLLDIGFKIK